MAKLEKRLGGGSSLTPDSVSADNSPATGIEFTAAFSREREGAAVALRKRTRMKRRTRTAARKALAVLVSVVLVVGLMPGFVAWGDLEGQPEIAHVSDMVAEDAKEVLTSGEDGVEQEKVDEVADESTETNNKLGEEEPIDEDAKRGLEIDEGGRASRAITDDALNENEDAEPLHSRDQRSSQIMSAMSMADETNLQASEASTANYVVSIVIDKSGNTTYSPRDWFYVLPGESIQFVNASPSDAANEGRITVSIGASALSPNDYLASTVLAVGQSVTWTNSLGEAKLLNGGYDGGRRAPFYAGAFSGWALIVDPNNGADKQSKLSNQGSAVNLQTVYPTAPTRAGYIFTGWNTNANGSGTHYATNASVSSSTDLTLYAEWQRTFVFKGAGGSSDVSATQNASDAADSSNATTVTAPGSPTSAIKEGWVNVPGWFEASAVDNTPVFESGQTRSDITNGSFASAYSDGTIPLYAMAKISATFIAGSHARADSEVEHYYNASGAYSDAKSVNLAGEGEWVAEGWAKSSAAIEATYAADSSGNVIVASSDIGVNGETWYAIMSRGVSVTYDVNEATGGAAPTSQTATQMHNASGAATTQPAVILAAKPADLVKKGYEFGGWNINGTTYQPGDTYKWESDAVAANVIAGAVWNPIDVTAPVGKTLAYTGADQELAEAGSVASPYTMQYSLSESGPYSASIPKAAAMGNYTVWYKVVDAGGDTVVDPASVAASISKGAPNVTPPTAKTLTYNGTEQELVTAGTTTGGTMVYSLEENGTYSTTIPKGKDAGSYAVWYKVDGDANYESTTPASVPVTIGQREATLEWVDDSFAYNGSDQAPTASVGNLLAGDACTVTVTGAQKDKGSYTATATGLSNPNYKLPASATHAFTITAKQVGITWAGDTFTYNGAQQAPTATLNASDIESGDTCTVTVTGGQKDAGSHTATATLSNDNYELASADASHAFTITPKAATLSWGATTFTYNGQEQAPTATVTNLETGDVCTVTVSGGQKNAGLAYTATATALSNANYTLPVNASTTFSIAKAMLTVTAKDNTITYGDAPSGNGAAYAGFVGGDTEAVLTGTLAYTYSYAQYDDVGDAYAITPGGLAADNYAITYANGTLKVDPREVTLVWSAPNEFDYTGSAQTWPMPEVEGTVNGDALTAVWKTAAAGAADAYMATVAGTYAPMVESLSGEKAGNYKLPADVTGSWRIKAPGVNNMAVSIAGWTYGKYNAAANAPTVTADFGASEATFAYFTDADCTQQVTGDALDTIGVPKNAGDYYVKATIPDDPSGNYPGASAVAAFTVSKADVTVTADDKQSVRGDALKALTYTAGGLVGGDSLDDYVEAAPDASPNDINKDKTGRYVVKAGWKSGVNSHPNYNIAFADGTYTVTRALANVAAVGWTGDYDGTDTGKQIAVTVSDAASGTQFDGSGTGAITVYYSEDDFQTSLGLSADQITALQGADIGTSDFTSAWNALQAALAGKSTDSPKYKDAGTHTVYFMVVSDQVTPDVIFGSKDVAIEKAQLVVSAQNKAITYGDAADKSGVAYSGFVGAESANDLGGELAYSYGGYAAGSPVGDYAITPSGLTSSNYDIMYKAGTLTVGKRAVTIEWPTPSAFAYNGSQQTYGPPTVGNLYGSDAVQAVCASNTNMAKDAGNYVAMVASLSGGAAGNYVLPSDTALLHHNWSITPAALIVTAKDSTVTYGDAPAGNGVTYDELLGEDTEASLTGSLAYTYTYAQYGGVGEYALTPSGLSSPNYTISYAAGKLTVEPREVGLAWPTPDSFDYTGIELTYGRPTLTGIVNGDDVSVGEYAGNAATDAGTHTAEVKSLTGAKAGNYKLPDDATHPWTIVGAANEATVTLEGWTYGDAANVPVVEAAFGADTATFAYFADEGCTEPVAAEALDSNGVPKNAGDYWVRATIPTAGSYEGAEATAKFTIAKRELGLVWEQPDALSYTGDELTYSAPTLGNAVDGDDVSVGEYGGNKGTHVGSYTATVTSLLGEDAANYVLPANAAHAWTIVIAANKATVTLAGWTYGDAANKPVATADFGADTATFTYAASEDGPYSDAVPTAAGTYWAKASIAATADYAAAEAVASFTISKRPATVTAKLQVVTVGAAIATGVDQVEFSGAVVDDALSAVTLSASSTASATEAGTITPSAAVVKNAADADMTANYEIAYKPARLIVAPAVTTANGKVIYALHQDIWMSVAEATVLCAATDRDAQIVELSDAHALLLSTGEELGVIVKEDGGLVPVVGDYELTLKANPELGVTVHVYDVSETDTATGVKVFANDTEPSADLLQKAKAGDADAIAALIKLAKASAVDADGNPIDVVSVDLAAVDPAKPGTYKAVYKTADGASVTANVTLKTDGSGDDGDDKGDKDGKGDNGSDDNGSNDKGSGNGDNGSGNDTGKNASNSSSNTTRKGASPTTGDAPWALYSLAASAVIAAGIALFARRRLDTTAHAKHKR